MFRVRKRPSMTTKNFRIRRTGRSTGLRGQYKNCIVRFCWLLRSLLLLAVASLLPVQLHERKRCAEVNARSFPTTAF